MLAVQRVKLAFAILWEAYDTNSGDRVHPYGVLQATGQQRIVTRILQAGLTAQTAEIAHGSDAQINAVNDRGVAVENGVAYRYYELYGQFPRGPFAGSALCDGVDTPVDVMYEGDLQINVRIPHLPQSDRYCTFRVSRNDGSHSLAFGPVVACAADTGRTLLLITQRHAMLGGCRRRCVPQRTPARRRRASGWGTRMLASMVT